MYAVYSYAHPNGIPLCTLICDSPTDAAQLYYTLFQTSQTIGIDLIMDGSMLHVGMGCIEQLHLLLHALQSYYKVKQHKQFTDQGIVYSTIEWERPVAILKK